MNSRASAFCCLSIRKNLPVAGSVGLQINPKRTKKPLKLPPTDGKFEGFCHQKRQNATTHFRSILPPKGECLLNRMVLVSSSGGLLVAGWRGWSGL
jgi:hypothetical protein